MAQYYTSALFALLALASTAAIPVRWTTDAYKVKPLVYECYHGETLDLAAALTAYGEPLNFAGKTAKLYWQTNGMNQVWWSTNAFVRAEGGVSNILAAIWSGSYDTGAASVTGFIGVEGENYRAAFQLNFRASPGFVPNAMPIPPQTIDWAKVSNTNVDSAPFALKGSGGGGVTTNDVRGIVEGYGYVTESVTNGLASTNYVNEAIASIPPSMTTNIVEDISDSRITNSVLTGYLCTSNAAAAMARGAYVAATNAAAVDASAKYIPFYEEDDDSYTISKGIICPYTYCDTVYVSDVYNLIYDGPTGHQSFKSYIDSATNALATVARTGSYDDLSDKPTAADIGAYEASKGEADHTTVSNLLAYVGGQNVRVSVTNYYGATSGTLPRLRIEENTNSTWITVWDEDDKFVEFKTNVTAEVAAMTNASMVALTSITNDVIQYADQTKAPKAWGMYASDGTLAPSDTVVHATSKTMFGGNTEFKCFAIGTDQVGFLVRKGTTAYSGTTPGEFKFYNMSGNHFFGMHIRDEVELGCDTASIIITQVGSDQMVTMTYSVTMTGKPSIHYTPTLDTNPIVWEKLSQRDGTQVPGASKAVTWEAVPPAGTEVCHINMGSAPKGFYYATIDDQAESWLHTDLVLNAQGGLFCTNEFTGLTVAVEPYIDDASNTVKWRVKP